MMNQTKCMVPEEFGVAFRKGWDAAIDEAIKAFAGDENWKLNIRAVLQEIKEKNSQ